LEKRIYDGTRFCGQGCCGCPVVDLDETTQTVAIHDPAKPENGRTIMTVLEWNALIKNVQPIEV
jgi:hypothetical protein